MIKPKKPIAFVCAAALLLSPTGALGASPSDFFDFPNDWSQGAMTAAVENGLLGGVGDGRIAPQGEVTRAQMAAIINRAFGAEKQASLSSYSDVAADAWYAVDMAKAVQMGTFSGTGNGLLEPDRAITREEAFSVLARAFALEAGDDSSLASFSDGAQVSSWAKGSVSAMVAAGYVNGSDGNRLNPQQTITRAEFAAVMSKIVAQYIDADSTLNRSLEIDGNVIVRGNVDLSGYTINGDVIIADEATNVTLDGVTVNGRLVVRGASDSLTISGSTADGVIITNPNGASVLKTDNASDLGTVTALGDLTLSGGQLDRLTIAESATITVEKDASVETITVSADDVTINGAGKVDKVQANADNVHVNVEDAEVTAGKGSSASPQAIQALLLAKVLRFLATATTIVRTPAATPVTVVLPAAITTILAVAMITLAPPLAVAKAPATTPTLAAVKKPQPLRSSTLKPPDSSILAGASMSPYSSPKDTR